jgi:hypothetical protein
MDPSCVVVARPSRDLPSHLERCDFDVAMVATARGRIASLHQQSQVAFTLVGRCPV